MVTKGGSGELADWRGSSLELEDGGGGVKSCW